MRDMKKRHQTAGVEIVRPENRVKVKITTNKENNVSNSIITCRHSQTGTFQVLPLSHQLHLHVSFTLASNIQVCVQQDIKVPTVPQLYRVDIRWIYMPSRHSTASNDNGSCSFTEFRAQR